MSFKLNKPKSGSGTPTPKDGEAILLLKDEILSHPVLGADGVTYEGSYVMKPEATFSTLYMTPSTQDASYETSGEADGRGRKNKFVGMYPGTTKEFQKFLRDHLDDDFIIIYGGCDATEKKVMGTKCVPMKLSASGNDNKDGNKNTLTFEEDMITNSGIRWYNGAMSFATYPEVGKDIAIDKDLGNVYQMTSSAAADDITVTGTDLVDGSIVSFIGGGGVGPLTLSNQVAEPVVLLKNATDWIALKNAVIDFRVCKSDKVYLVEVSRR